MYRILGFRILGYEIGFKWNFEEDTCILQTNHLSKLNYFIP